MTLNDQQYTDYLRAQTRMWRLMLAAPFLYLLLAMLLGQPWQESALARQMLPVLRIFWGVAAALAAMFAWRGWRQSLAGKPPRVVRWLAKRLLATMEPHTPPVFVLHQAAQAVSLALAEVVALMGLLLYLLGASVLELFVYANLCAILIIALRPTPEGLLRMEERLHKPFSNP